MKKLILVLLSGFSLLPYSSSQDQDLRVVASAGASYQTTGVQLDWTLGEVIIHTLESNSSMLSQGFHQPNTNLVSLPSLPLETGTLLAWPNPFKDGFQITLELKSSHRGEIGLYDMTGHLFWTGSFEGKTCHKNVSLPSLASGQYVLTASFADDLNKFAYPMIKTQ